MRLVIQRVRGASVVCGDLGHEIARIGRGVVVLVGIGTDDDWADIEYCIRKILKSRLWSDLDDHHKSWSTSVEDNGFEVLLVSQFTLHGNLKKGNKPDFHGAMKSDFSAPLFTCMVEEIKKRYHPDKIQTGNFGHYMHLDILGDGPVTLTVDSSKIELKRSGKMDELLTHGTPQVL
mmetsp:Transcript_1552/g.1804  ORF Transcript_1552/g.1804 Transcript_1552/m.1804 type:complete len:176 (-) Transcript_1552:361-888(-)